MNIKKDKIINAGVISDERVSLEVLVDDKLGYYGIFKSKKIGEDSVSSAIKKTYWFPDRDVKKGDFVVLYSKVGVNTSKINTDGTTSHFFYWGMSEPLWSENDDAAILFRLDTWTF